MFFVLSALSIMPRSMRTAFAGRSGGSRGRGGRSGAADHDGNGTVSRPPTGEGSSASAALQEANLRVASMTPFGRACVVSKCIQGKFETAPTRQLHCNPP